MGMLSSAINPIRGMMGEFYNSGAARRAMGVARNMSGVARNMGYRPYVGVAGAGVGMAGGAIAGGRDHRMRGAMMGGVLGAGVGLRPGRSLIGKPSVAARWLEAGRGVAPVNRMLT